ncbi:nascent polypeptide-associated complex protein [Candidatus Woesearchaeota archaeon]|nr:nascent polypeptide-associated complex protein [Candidatus Woesearchaeota archaeon]
MFPGLSQREVQKAMKKLGIKQEEIDAELVIIKTHDKDFIIRNPQVSRVNMMGQETFQVVGSIEEAEKDSKAEINEDDITTVMDQTSCTREEAVEAIEESNGNLAEAILKLQNK